MLLFCAAVSLGGCGLFGEDLPSPKIPDNLQIYTSVFGKGAGIWTFDPNTFEVQDTLQTGSSWGMSFSPDNRITYPAWRDSGTDISKVYAFYVHTKEMLREQEVWNPNAELDHSGNRLVSMGGNPGIQILDAHTFEILYEGHTHLRNLATKMTASPLRDEIYALVHLADQPGVAGVMVLNTQTFEIEAIIPLTDDENRRRSMQGSYIDISPDGRYVYATVFNWQGGGGYGSFHVIDLQDRRQIFESLCGGFAWIGVAPNGRYVYLSDSAGTPFYTFGISFEFPPTNQMLRYDVQRRSMSVFADGGSDFGLGGTHLDLLITSAIAVAPDSRSMFIRVLSAGQTSDGISPRLMHIDTRTKELINVYNLPPDPDGFTRAHIHHLKIGFRP